MTTQRERQPYAADRPPRASTAGHGGGLTRQAVGATLHCLTGCAIGEILEMVLATWWGWGNAASIVLSIALAFGFGYALTMRPVLRAGLRSAPRCVSRSRPTRSRSP